MPTTIDLRRPFDFSKLPIVIVAGIFALLTTAIILMILYNVIKDMKRAPKEEIQQVAAPVFVKPDISKLKGEYLGKLNAIEAKYNEDRTKIRPAYEAMSLVVREFVHKATGIDVDKFTLSELTRTEFRGLTELIGEYYKPEFDQISEGDVLASLEKSRRLVTEWN